VDRTPLVIAHRGAAAEAPENSVEAFERAIAIGVDMVEFDVRRTRDGQLIAIHDATAGGVPVRELTRAEIATRHAGWLPPLVSEVVELTAGRVGLDVELKEDGYVDQVLRVLAVNPEPGLLVVTSFLDEVVAQVKRRATETRAGLLVGVARPARPLRTRLSELYPVARARRCRADFLAPHFALARLGVLSRAAQANLPVFVWTVNDDATLRQLIADERVAAIITDVPDRALAIRADLRGTR
jgi:glycerophosphoryl diester phosphodiesterase